MKKLAFVLLILFAKNKLAAQITLIPDYRFERALIDLNIDSDQTINGQILTGDALGVIELNLSPATLPNYPYPASDIYEGMIHDLSGIEAFINLEHLVVNTTMVDNLNLDNLTQLKYLDCVDNMLTSINVSNNPLLEYIRISDYGDALPLNNIVELDLSANPNVNNIKAKRVRKLNLNNNNNIQNMLIDVGCTCFGDPVEVIYGTACIKVDNVLLAQSNMSPYSEWNVYHANINVNYTNDLSQCSLGTSKFEKEAIAIAPNPASDILYLNHNGAKISKIMVFDLLGREIFRCVDLYDSIDVSALQSGHYILKIISEKGEQTEKLIVE